MLTVYGPYNVGDIPSGSELLLHPFPLLRAIRAAQIFILEIGKDGSVDREDEFADGGLANQCLSIIASLNTTSKGFLKLVTDFLMYAFFLMWCMHSSVK